MNWKEKMERKLKGLKRSQDKWKYEKYYLTEKKKILSERLNLLSPAKPQLTTTKWLIAFLFLNCLGIEIFTGWVIYQNIQLAFLMGTSLDLTPLVALIGAVVGEVIGFAIYALKSVKENSRGGIIYEKAMQDIQEEEVIE